MPIPPWMMRGSSVVWVKIVWPLRTPVKAGGATSLRLARRTAVPTVIVLQTGNLSHDGDQQSGGTPVQCAVSKAGATGALLKPGERLAAPAERRTKPLLTIPFVGRIKE